MSTIAALILSTGVLAAPPAVEAELRKTPGGIAFALAGKKPDKPAPTVVIFAGAAKATVIDPVYAKVGHRLLGDGVLLVSLDLPSHGDDVRPDDPPGGIAGWRHRLEKGENPIEPFTARVREVLDYLVKEGYTDPKRIALAGTSRGGYIAFQTAAADPRVSAVIAFAPVTDLLALREFKGMEQHAATQALHLRHLADRLAGRSVWLCIGNHDERVDSDQAIAFTRQLVRAAVAKKAKPDVLLVVTPTPGHSIHKTAHDEAADWLRARLLAPADRP